MLWNLSGSFDEDDAIAAVKVAIVLFLGLFVCLFLMANQSEQKFTPPPASAWPKFSEMKCHIDAHHRAATSRIIHHKAYFDFYRRFRMVRRVNMLQLWCAALQYCP